MFESWLETEKAEVAAAIKDFDVDYEYEKILEWCAANRRLQVIWVDKFVDGEGNEVAATDELTHWSLSWKYGTIGFDGMTKDDEAKARKAAALFVYLWVKDVSASVAERCAVSYVLTYTIQKI